jgi:hypothetical protein
MDSTSDGFLSFNVLVLLLLLHLNQYCHLNIGGCGSLGWVTGWDDDDNDKGTGGAVVVVVATTTTTTTTANNKQQTTIFTTLLQPSK